MSRFLSLKPVVWVGLLSYSLYLWHWVLFALRNYWEDIHIPEFYKSDIFLIFLTFAFASFSYYVVEKPLRVAKIQRKKLFFSVTFAVMAVFTVIGSYIAVKDGLPERIPAEAAKLNYVPHSSFKKKECYELPPEKIKSGEMCLIGDKTAERDFILWGDSHALALSDGVNKLADEIGGAGSFAANSSCPPLLGLKSTDKTKAESCDAFNLAVADRIAADDSIKRVILVCRWSEYTKTDAGLTALMSALDATVNRLKGREIYFVLDNVEAGFDVPSVLAKEAMLKNRLPALASERQLTLPESDYTDKNGRMLSLMEKYSGRLSVVPLYKSLCENGECITAHDGHALYYDDDHLSTYGAEYAVFKGRVMMENIIK